MQFYCSTLLALQLAIGLSLQEASAAPVNSKEKVSDKSPGSPKPKTATSTASDAEIKAAAEYKKTEEVFKQALKTGSKLFMWRATSESGATVFLLGTIHVFKKEFYPMPAEIEKAFDKSKALLLEVKPEEEGDETSSSAK